MKPIVSVADPVPILMQTLLDAGFDIDHGGWVPIEQLNPRQAKLRMRVQMGYTSSDENLLAQSVTHQIALMAVSTSADVCVQALEDAFETLFNAQWGMVGISYIALATPAGPILTESESVVAYEIALRVST